MRLLDATRWLTLRMTLALAAGVWGVSPAWGQPCDCAVDESLAGGFDGAAYAPPGEPPLPPAAIYAGGPCAFTPHDVDPCYNMRCYLYPSSPKAAIYTQLDLAPLFRDPNRDIIFQTAGPQGPVALGTQTLEPEFQGGLRFMVGGRFNDLYRVETTYLGLHDWNDVDTARDFSANAFGSEGNLFSPFSNFGDPDFNFDGGVDGVVGLDFNNLASLNVQSRFDSIESNVLVDIPRMRNLESAVMLGVRYIRIDEELGFQTASNEPAGGADLAIRNAVNNDLIGLQLGYRARFLVERRMWLDYDMKGAIYNNNIEHRLSYRQSQGGVGVGAFDDQADVEKTSFGGELGLVLHYLVTPNFAVRLGYQAMWFTGLGLAAENAIPPGARVTTPGGGPNTLVFQPLEVNHSGEVVYHGPVAGIMAMW